MKSISECRKVGAWLEHKLAMAESFKSESYLSSCMDRWVCSSNGSVMVLGGLVKVWSGLFWVRDEPRAWFEAKGLCQFVQKNSEACPVFSKTLNDLI